MHAFYAFWMLAAARETVVNEKKSITFILFCYGDHLKHARQSLIKITKSYCGKRRTLFYTDRDKLRYTKIFMLLFKRETGSESGIGSSPATSYTSLNLEIDSVEQTFLDKTFAD